MKEENKSTETLTEIRIAEKNNSQRLAFKMKLHKGQEAEYKKRHDELWPELQLLLKETGVSDYSIFLEESTGDLLGVLKVQNPILMDKLPLHPVMQKWWAFMKDIMDSNSDNSPVSISLKEVFHLD
jgi:L-rhamnose mutarotase